MTGPFNFQLECANSNLPANLKKRNLKISGFENKFSLELNFDKRRERYKMYVGLKN